MVSPQYNCNVDSTVMKCNFLNVIYNKWSLFNTQLLSHLDVLVGQSESENHSRRFLGLMKNAFTIFPTHIYVTDGPLRFDS